MIGPCNRAVRDVGVRYGKVWGNLRPIQIPTLLPLTNGKRLVFILGFQMEPLQHPQIPSHADVYCK